MLLGKIQLQVSGLGTPCLMPRPPQEHPWWWRDEDGAGQAAMPLAGGRFPQCTVSPLLHASPFFGWPQRVLQGPAWGNQEDGGAFLLQCKPQTPGREMPSLGFMVRVRLGEPRAPAHTIRASNPLLGILNPLGSLSEQTPHRLYPPLE